MRVAANRYEPGTVVAEGENVPCRESNVCSGKARGLLLFVVDFGMEFCAIVFIFRWAMEGKLMHVKRDFT